MNPNDFITENETINNTKLKALQDRANDKKHEIEVAQVLGAISKAGKDITLAIDKIKILKNEVMSHSPKDKTAHKLLSNLEKAIKGIKIDVPKPEKFPNEISVKGQKDYSQKIDDVIAAVQAIQVSVEPNITVKPTDVKVNTDFTTLEKKLDLVTKAVQAISIIVPEQDDSKILDRLAGVTKAINSLSFPVPNFILPFKDTEGEATQVEASIFSDINGIGIPSFDFCSQTQDTLTDTWVFKTGGSGGTTVATVVITYTDAGKTIISSVART